MTLRINKNRYLQKTGLIIEHKLVICSLSNHLIYSKLYVIFNFYLTYFFLIFYLIVNRISVSKKIRDKMTPLGKNGLSVERQNNLVTLFHFNIPVKTIAINDAFKRRLLTVELVNDYGVKINRVAQALQISYLLYVDGHFIPYSGKASVH